MVLSNIQNTVSFTGHRPDKLGGFDDNNPTALKVKDALKKEIVNCINKGFNSFISGGAMGVDQWAAEVIIELKKTHKIKLIIAKPFPSQDKVWKQETKEKFKKMCLEADEVVNVSDDPYAAWKMMARNKYMIDHSSLIIAVYNGDPTGGTAQTVKQAQKIGKQILIIDPNKL